MRSRRVLVAADEPPQQEAVGVHRARGQPVLCCVMALEHFVDPREQQPLHSHVHRAEMDVVANHFLVVHLRSGATETDLMRIGANERSALSN